MSGIQLSGLEASDLVDTLHFFFEEDNRFSTEEEMLSRSQLREQLYGNLYGKPYKYKASKSNSRSSSSASYAPDASMEYDDAANDPNLSPFEPKMEHKGFVPATEFDPESDNPFGGILDAPL